MLIRFILIMMFPLAFLACRKSDTVPAPSAVDSMRMQYLLPSLERQTLSGSVIIDPSAGVTPRVYFTYVDGKVARRDGGFLSIPTGAGWTYKYTRDIYDVVAYYPDSIIIRTEDMIPDVTVLPNKRKLILENGRLRYRLYYSGPNNADIDTIKISYDASGKANKAEVFLNLSYTVKTFTYNVAGNLTQVNGTTYARDNNQKLKETLEMFEGYDNSANPLKNLWLWDDLFFRSLSSNNFTKCSSMETQLGAGGTTIAVHRSTSVWTFKYDNRGRIQLGL
jgi:hypothetical protein